MPRVPLALILGVLLAACAFEERPKNETACFQVWYDGAHLEPLAGRDRDSRSCGLLLSAEGPPRRGFSPQEG